MNNECFTSIETANLLGQIFGFSAGFLFCLFFHLILCLYLKDKSKKN